MKGLALGMSQATNAILQRLRQVLVIERRERRNVVGDEVVQEPVVEVEAFRIWRAGALGEYPRPRNREPIRSGGQRLHRPHVVSVSVIVIIGDVAVVVVADLSRRVRERVPDRRATAILTDGAFDLIGGGSGAQRNPAGKAREDSRPAAAPSPGRAPDGAAVADAPRADAPTMESWRRVNRVGIGNSTIEPCHAPLMCVERVGRSSLSISNLLHR